MKRRRIERVAAAGALALGVSGCSSAAVSAWFADWMNGGARGGAQPAAPTSAHPSAIRTRPISLGNLTFNARVAGPPHGELVLLLHGFPQTSYEWRHQLPALGRAGFRAVAPDQRGYSPGARPVFVLQYTVLHLALDILAMADSLRAWRFHLVGHDWGAVVAWIVTRLAPQRVITLNALSIPHPDALAAALVNENSCQSSASGYFDDFLAPNVEDIALADDAAVLRSVFQGVESHAIEEYLRVLGNRDALGAALNWYRANLTPSNGSHGATLPALQLGRIHVPTLYIWGDRDGTVCRDAAERTASYVAAPYRFEVLEGVNHWIPDTASDRLTPLLLAHLQRYREQRPRQDPAARRDR
jgi:pimeloyl-ACP methyl ester carboxylesterase